MSSTISGFSTNKSIRLQYSSVPNAEHGTLNTELFNPKPFKPQTILQEDQVEGASSFPPIADDSIHPP